MDIKDKSNGGTNRRIRCTTCGRGPSFTTDGHLERTGVCTPCQRVKEANMAAWASSVLTADPDGDVTEEVYDLEMAR